MTRATTAVDDSVSIVRVVEATWHELWVHLATMLAVFPANIRRTVAWRWHRQQHHDITCYHVARTNRSVFAFRYHSVSCFRRTSSTSCDCMFTKPFSFMSVVLLSSPESDPRNRAAWTKSLHALLSILLLVRGVVVVPSSNAVFHSHCGQSFQAALLWCTTDCRLNMQLTRTNAWSPTAHRIPLMCFFWDQTCHLQTMRPGIMPSISVRQYLQNRKKFDNLACEECTRSLFWIEYVTRKKCVEGKISHGNLNSVSCIAIFSPRIAGRKLRAISSQIDQSSWLLLKLFPHLEIMGRKFDDHRYEAFQLFRVHGFSCVGARSISPHIFQRVGARSSNHLSVFPKVNCMPPFRKSHSWLVSFLARWFKIRFSLSLSELPRENWFNNDVGPSHLAEVSPLRS